MDSAILIAPSDSEQWRPIPEWEGEYHVSDFGRVRSLQRLITDRTGRHAGRQYVIPGRILKPAMTIHGYPFVSLCRNASPRLFVIHRLVYEAFVGPIPVGMEVDHRDRNKANSRLSNLRLGTKSQNKANVCAPRTNTSGHKGVQWQESRQRWRARIKVNGQDLFLGRFATFEEATAAYRIAANQHFGEFAHY